VGYLFSNGDGVHGRLTSDETRQAFARLDALPLPRDKATLTAAHEQLRQSQPSTEQPIGAWEALSLSFVRPVAAIAVSQGRGLLWGNDLPKLPASATERHHD
jgi:hypothetical protein